MPQKSPFRMSGPGGQTSKSDANVFAQLFAGVKPQIYGISPVFGHTCCFLVHVAGRYVNRWHRLGIGTHACFPAFSVPTLFAAVVATRCWAHLGGTTESERGL